MDMKKYFKEIAILIAQLLMFYVFPLTAGPTDAMGMVFLIIVATFVLAIIMGSVSKKKAKYVYPLLVSVLFIPSVFIYYNDSALIHSIWYLVISSVEIERLRDFKNHPFKVQADSQMKELQESIKKYGILNPLIVRPSQEGFYEIISGHRRKYAAQQLKYTKVPVIIRYMIEEDTIISKEENLLKVIAGEKESPERNQKLPVQKDARPEKRKFDLVVDSQEKMAQGKNRGYVRWAKKYNVKQFTESILFLQQHDIHDKQTLDALVAESSA